MIIVKDITARNAIPSGDRTDGDVVYVSELGEYYRLVGGIADANWKSSGAFFAEAEYANGDSGAAFTWDLGNGRNQSVTLNNAACALTIDASDVGVGTFKLKVTQDGSGSRAFASGAISGGTVRTPDGTSGLTLSSGGGDVDLIWGYYDGTDFYIGVGALDMVAWT